MQKYLFIFKFLSFVCCILWRNKGVYLQYHHTAQTVFFLLHKFPSKKRWLHFVSSCAKIYRNTRDTHAVCYAVCSISVDEPLKTLFRVAAVAEDCPVAGPHTFAYSRGHGLCDYPMSSMSGKRIEEGYRQKKISSRSVFGERIYSIACRFSFFA